MAGAGGVGDRLTGTEGLVWHPQLSYWIRWEKARPFPFANFAADDARGQLLDLNRTTRVEQAVACEAAWRGGGRTEGRQPGGWRALRTHGLLRIFSQVRVMCDRLLSRNVVEFTTKKPLCCVRRVCPKNASTCSNRSSSSRGWLGFLCFILDTSSTRWSPSIIDPHSISECSRWKCPLFWNVVPGCGLLEKNSLFFCPSKS